ncbi:efflux RND transporter periplasmic adaptor subunit [Marinobacterium mangrovicola]|uniref:RND family efflux transporter MFP subunit n=1 Tax=Marinobacterium mangrovicola TaxID=1476959 RepID=A0A4R1GSJ5_9GAMM|nr:efflux RND transporter periplasmic adaptor subunit [Marinobacterium mangrovicola]TCK07582.1 RND family efflux transporter MFP subunit [Marinobacterium mangrovicola]
MKPFPLYGALLVGCLALAPGLKAEEFFAQGYKCVIEPRATIKLGSSEDGVIEEVLVKRGEKVTEGQPVANLERALETISVDLAKMKAESNEAIRSARVQVDFRRKELDRLVSLREKNVISAKDYDQAEVELRLTRLSLDSAAYDRDIAEVEYEYAKQKLARRVIRSPVDGIVTEVSLGKGEYAYEQAPLMTIAAIDPLHVEVYLPVQLYSEIEIGMAADVSPELVSDSSYRAWVIAIDSVFDASSRTFGVRLELPNQDYQLPAGMHCSLQFLRGEEGSIAQQAQTEAGS